MDGGRWQLMPRLEQSHTSNDIQVCLSQNSGQTDYEEKYQTKPKSKGYGITMVWRKDLEYQRGNQKP